MTATYNAEPSYTVTIPASATIVESSTSDVTQRITAENVMLKNGQRLVVKLDAAQHTTEANTDTFTAKNGDSDVTYNIFKDDKKITLGGNVAECVTKTKQQSAALKFVKINDSSNTPEFAGAHTETLTFSIAVT